MWKSWCNRPPCSFFWKVLQQSFVDVFSQIFFFFPGWVSCSSFWIVVSIETPSGTSKTCVYSSLKFCSAEWKLGQCFEAVHVFRGLANAANFQHKFWILPRSKTWYLKIITNIDFSPLWAMENCFYFKIFLLCLCWKSIYHLSSWKRAGKFLNRHTHHPLVLELFWTTAEGKQKGTLFPLTTRSSEISAKCLRDFDKLA